MNTMNSLKTLLLAGAAALSIGVGGAMAAGSGVAGPDYWAAQQQAAARQAARQNPTATSSRNSTVQYGSSDVDSLHQPVGADASLGVAGGF
jgi:hypothetical protein